MNPQRGFVALLMMVLVAVGVFGAMAAWVAKEPPRSKQSINQEVLAQAREALLAYVAVSDGTTASMSYSKTRLPCPDRIGDGVADISNCRANGETVAGLLPWSTLGLPPLRDADGECLWYAVSGDFKNAASASNVVNADTTGVITVVDEVGNTLASQVVAVVFAPGMNLTQQARNAMTGGADKPCATPGSNAVTDASIYLDTIVVSGRPPIDNAQPAAAASAPVTFAQSAGPAAKQLQLNDQLAWITTEDYAAAATLRNAEVLKKLFKTAVGDPRFDGLQPFAADVPGGICKPNLYSGFLPRSCPYTNAAGTTITFTLDPVPSEAMSDHWHELAFYAVTPGCAFNAVSFSCDTTSGTALLALPKNPTAKAVLLMRGRQPSPNCPATTAATEFDKWLPCIEGTNQTALSNPTTVRTRVFVTPDKRPISNDVLKELP